MRTWTARLWLPALFAAVWEAAAALGWLDPLFFPAPHRLLASSWQLAEKGDLFRHLGATLGRLAGAYIIGSACGTAAGLILGSLPFWRRSLEGVFSGLYATPKLSLLPAFLVLFGMNGVSRMLPAGISCFVLMAAYSMDAARAVKPGYIELARSYGAGRRALFFRVYLPASLPILFTGLRLGLGNALLMVVATEMLGAATGLGALIWIASQTLAMDRMYVGIALCTLVGIGTNYLFEKFERRVTPWTH
jgi:ABC-type nitrate/sulfonate/bicarbonate transport system permease component